MDTFTTRQGSAFSELLDAFLADIAIRIQLSQTNYDKAVARYTIRSTTGSNAMGAHWPGSWIFSTPRVPWRFARSSRPE